MRLLDCRLQNLRLHGDLALRFAPGLTLIGGPNETGKSSLVEGLHRCLFLKAAASGPPVESLRSRRHSGHPIVELGFEARGMGWRLIKRFTGANGTVSLTSEQGSQVSGAAAEEALAQLLGVGDSVGSKQAGTVLPSRWAHLWVMQGHAGDDLLARGGSHYDLEALIQRLEAGGGTAMQSPLDQRVAQELEALLAVNFTSKRDDVRKNSPLWRAQQALDAGERDLEAALARLADYEHGSDELARIGAELGRLREQDLPALEAERRALVSAAAALRQCDGAIELRSKDLMPLRLRHQDLQRDQGELGQLEQELASADQQRQALCAQLQRASDERLALDQGLSSGRQTLEALSQQLDRTLQRGQLVLKLKERGRLEAERRRQQQQRQRQIQRQKRRRELESQLTTLAPVNGDQLAELRQHQSRLRDARTRIEALATGLQLLQTGGQVVRIDGVPLMPGAERRLTRSFELELGEAVRLRISPGGAEVLGDGEAALARAEADLHQALQALGIDSVSQAETVVSQRQTISQQLAALEAAELASGEASRLQPAQARQDPESLEEPEGGLDSRLAELDRELAALAELRQALASDQALPEHEAGLESLHRQLQQTYRQQRSDQQQAEQELQQLQARRLQLGRIEAAAAQALAALEAERRTRQQRQQALLARCGSVQALAEGLGAIEGQRLAAEAELAALQRQRQGLQPGGGEDRLEAIGVEIDQLGRQIAQLGEDLGAARERCDSISAQAPHAAVEKARVKRNGAAAEHQALERRSEAQKLLAQLFAEARADLSARYSLPLARSIEQFLLPLLPDGPRCQLHYDQARGFTGLQLRRSGEDYPFNQLSGGMREQLAAALRLAMADVLRGDHDGCLPLIFDDAFTNSDLERLDGLKAMLQAAVRGGLQVILLTCQPERYGDLEATTVELQAGSD